VVVKWKVATENLSQVCVQASCNGTNGPWKLLFNKGIAVPHDIEVTCMDTVWIIGNEYEPIDYAASQTILLRVKNYQAAIPVAVSSMITVNR